MSRLLVLLIVAVLLVGALVFLSSLPKEQPTQTIDVPVSQAGAAGGYAR